MSRDRKIKQDIPTERPQERTWHGIRQELLANYGKWYSPGDLRTMEVKWRRIFAEAGWNMKGI